MMADDQQPLQHQRHDHARAASSVFDRLATHATRSSPRTTSATPTMTEHKTKIGGKYAWFHNSPKRQPVELVGATRPSSYEFSMLSYNILASVYLKHSYYPWAHKSPEVLSWAFRGKQLVREICSYGVDLICLQEIEANAFREFFQPELKAKGGYDVAHFYKRTSLMSRRFDGCAFFYKSNKFRRVAEKLIEFNDHARHHVQLKTDNIAALLALQFVYSPPPSSSTSSSSSSTVHETISSVEDHSPRESASSLPILVVGNTHLCHRYVNARNFQAKIYLREAQAFKEKIIALHPDHRVGLIASGDFNAGPASTIYRLFETEGGLTSVYSLLEERKEPSQDVSYQNDGDRDPTMGSTMFTNFVENPSMIDYIWVSEELITTSLLSLPEELLLPNFYLSSDHVALVASLAI